MWEGQSLSSGMDSKLQAPIGSFKPMVAQIILAKFSGSQNNNRSHKLGKGMFRESNKGGIYYKKDAGYTCMKLSKNQVF